jgi:hypothetical protein
MEIIVVDDGSIDRTWDIINSYADSRLVKLRKANGGVSSARNMGLEHVSGRYIQFLDADDILHPRKLEAQVRRLETAGDDCISTSKWGRFYRDLDDVKFVPEKNWTDLTPSDFAILEFGGGGTMPPNSWLMPRALIGSLRFHSIDAFEDDLFMAQMLTRTRQVVFASESISYYRSQNPRSLTAQYNVANCLCQYISHSRVADIMLTLSQSEPMKIAAANLMLSLALRAFPVDPELARIAEQKSRALGIANFDPHQVGGKFKTVAKYIGWRRAAALRYRYTILRKELSRILVDRAIG